MPGARKETTPITADAPHYAARSVELGDMTVAFETIRDDVEAVDILLSHYAVAGPKPARRRQRADRTD